MPSSPNTFAFVVERTLSIPRKHPGWFGSEYFPLNTEEEEAFSVRSVVVVLVPSSPPIAIAKSVVVGTKPPVTVRYKIVNVVVFATNAFTLKEEEEDDDEEDKEHPPTKRRFVGVLLLLAVVLFKDDDKRGEDKDTTDETIIYPFGCTTNSLRERKNTLLKFTRLKKLLSTEQNKPPALGIKHFPPKLLSMLTDVISANVTAVCSSNDVHTMKNFN